MLSCLLYPEYYPALLLAIQFELDLLVLCRAKQGSAGRMPDRNEPQIWIVSVSRQHNSADPGFAYDLDLDPIAYCNGVGQNLRLYRIG